MIVQEITKYSDEEVRRRLLRIYELILNAEDEMAKKLLINEEDLKPVIEKPERKHVDQVIMFMEKMGWDVEYGRGRVELEGVERGVFDADLQDAIELVGDLNALRIGAG